MLLHRQGFFLGGGWCLVVVVAGIEGRGEVMNHHFRPHFW